MSLNGIILEMYNEVMRQIENNLFEERLNSKESFRKAIALWKNLPEAKKESEAKRILKASKREGYIVKQKDILAYADKIEDYGKIKAKKSVRKDLRSKKSNKFIEKFKAVAEKVKNTKDSDLDLSDLTSIPKDFVFPKVNNGRLNLSNLTSIPEGVKFPESVETLYLSNLTSIPKDFKFPEKVGGVLDLSSLKSIPEGVKFPEGLRDLNLSSLESIPKGVKFPEGLTDLNLSLSLKDEFKQRFPNLVKALK